MPIYQTPFDDQYLLVTKERFCFVMRGVQTHYTQPLRFMLNLAHGIMGNEGQDLLLSQWQKALISEMGVDKMVNLNVKQVCEKYEDENINKVFAGLSREDQSNFLNIFGSLHSFGDRPVIGFRNKRGIDYV